MLETFLHSTNVDEAIDRWFSWREDTKTEEDQPEFDVDGPDADADRRANMEDMMR